MIFLFILLGCLTNILADNFLAKESKHALNENKLILLSVKSDQCPYCIRMERDIFNQESYKRRIVSKFIYLEMKHNDSKLPAFLHVKYLPTYYILSPNNLNIIDEFAGYMKPDDFLELIEEVYQQTKNR